MRRKIPKLTIERLKEAFDYDPGTGLFTWKVRIGHAYPGKTVSVIANDKAAPYIYICLDNERLYAHRVAWFYMTGKWPQENVDHRNGVHNDNRWSNLRLAAQQQNLCNTRIRSDNKSGYKGVCWSKSHRCWVAQIQVNGRNTFIGHFKTPEEAYAAYVARAKETFGEFFRAA